MKLSAQLVAFLCIVTLAACEQQVAVGTGPGATDPAVTQAEPDAAVDLARDFELVAFRESGVTVSRATNLRRMEAPLTMIVNTASASAAARRESAMVDTAMEALQTGAGVRFTRPRPAASGTPEIGPDQRGFVVMFADSATIAEIVSGADASVRAAVLGAGCGSMDVSEADGTPLGAIILVDAGRPTGEQSYCLHREMVANIGLAGFLRRADSIFSNSTGVPTFSARDLVLIRMLYDPRLRNGMTPAQVRPLLSQIATDALAR
jgi:hypothetical protein